MAERAPPLVDTFTQTNPAFGALCLRWISEGYQEESARRGADLPYVSPFWALVGLVLLTPEQVRANLPERATAKLSGLLYEHPEWRATIADGVRGWVAPFWDAFRLGVATRVLALVDGRLRATGTVQSPATASDLALRRKAVTLGRLLAKESGDEARSLVFGVSVDP